METKDVRNRLFVSMFWPVLEKPRFHRLQSKRASFPFVSIAVSIFVSRFLGIGGRVETKRSGERIIPPVFLQPTLIHRLARQLGSRPLNNVLGAGKPIFDPLPEHIQAGCRLRRNLDGAVNICELPFNGSLLAITVPVFGEPGYEGCTLAFLAMNPVQADDPKCRVLTARCPPHVLGISAGMVNNYDSDPVPS